jgi:hypothetical protein
MKKNGKKTSYSIKQAVDGYINDNSTGAELIFSDFKKIQYAFQIMKDCICGKGGERPGDKEQTKSSDLILSADQSEQLEKMRKLADHRDNEISIRC